MALEKFFLCGHFQPEARSVLGLLDYPDSYRFLIHLLFSTPGSGKIRWQAHSLACPFWWWQCSLVTNLYQWENWFGLKRLTYGSNNTLIWKRMCSFTKQLVPLKTHQWFVLHTCASGAVIMNYLQHDLELLRKRWTCCRSFTQSIDLK